MFLKELYAIFICKSMTNLYQSLRVDSFISDDMIKSDNLLIFTIFPIHFIINFTISDVGITFILQQRRPIHEISIQKVKRYPFPNPGSFFGNIMSNKGERAE